MQVSVGRALIDFKVACGVFIINDFVDEFRLKEQAVEPDPLMHFGIWQLR